MASPGSRAGPWSPPSPGSSSAAIGVNVGIFTPAVCGAAKPRDLETWHAAATRERVEFVRRDWADARVFVFPRAPFMVGGATMTQDDLDDGRLVCLVGVPSSRPAEFVMFRDLFPNNPPQ